MKNSIIVAVALAFSACASYSVKPAPEDAPRPVSLGGKSLVALTPDGAKVAVWYHKPEEVVLILLRQISAASKELEDAKAAESKRAYAAEAENAKCQAFLVKTGLKP